MYVLKLGNMWDCVPFFEGGEGEDGCEQVICVGVLQDSHSCLGSSVRLCDYILHT